MLVISQPLRVCVIDNYIFSMSVNNGHHNGLIIISVPFQSGREIITLLTST